MRFSDLAGKELVDVRNGVRLGELGDADLIFEAKTGRLRGIALLARRSWWRRYQEAVIPWRSIRKIGIDLILVELETAPDFADEPHDGSPRRPY